MGLLDNFSASEMEEIAGLLASIPTLRGGRSAVAPLANRWLQAGDREKAEKRQKMLDERSEQKFGFDMAQANAQINQQAAQQQRQAQADTRAEDQRLDRRDYALSFDPKSALHGPMGLLAGASPQEISQYQLSKGLLGGISPKQLMPKTKAPDPFTLSPGQTRFSGAGQQIAAIPEAVKSEDQRKKSELTFKQEKDLRGEFTKATSTFSDINNAYGRIRVSAENPSAAGDMSLIFNYMKMLDPASVVRESEFALAAASGDYGDRIQGAVNKVVNGQKLSEAQRADFVGRSKHLYNEAATIHKGRKSEFQRLAEANKLNPENVTFNRQFYKIPKTQATVKTPVGKVTDFSILSDDDFLKARP